MTRAKNPDAAITHPENHDNREFVISRKFGSPREIVWKALTEPGRMEQWWGPKGMSGRVVKLDLRPGGLYHYCLTTPDGHEMWGKFVYREVAAPERLVFINSFSDSEGGNTRHPMSPTWPMELLSTFTLEETDGETTLTIRWTPHNSTAEEIQTFESSHESMQKGWTGTLDQLAGYLSDAC